MPLNTAIVRDGKALSLRWGGFHLTAMVVAAAIDSGEGPWEDNTLEGILGDNAPVDGGPIRIGGGDIVRIDYLSIGATPLNNGEYTLRNGFKFEDLADGEILELHAGDTLVAYRNF